jgi:FtsZ-binding cell division protein ZapB
MQVEMQDGSTAVETMSESVLLASLSAIIEPLKEQNLVLQQALEELKASHEDLNRRHNELLSRYNALCESAIGLPVLTRFVWRHYPNLGFVFQTRPS